MSITYTHDLDMSPGVIPATVHVNQYDDDFSIVFTLYSTKGTFTVESGTTAEIRGTKLDGNGYSADCTINISAKTVTVAGHKQMTAVAGRNVFELVLKKSNKEISTANFILCVERAAMDAGTIQSDSVLKELNAIIAGAATATAAATAAQAAQAAAEAAAATLEIDDTLTHTGQAADAKKTGDEITDLKGVLDEVTEGGEVEVDRSNFVNMSGYFIGGTYNTIQQATGTAMMYIPCQPSTEYTINKILSDRFVIGYTGTVPQTGMAPSGVETHNSETSVNYDTGSDAAYLCIYYRRDSDTLTESEIYNSISISYPGGTDLTAVDKVARNAGAVRYDLVQSLTNTEKKQARENIGTNSIEMTYFHPDYDPYVVVDSEGYVIKDTSENAIIKVTRYHPSYKDGVIIDSAGNTLLGKSYDVADTPLAGLQLSIIGDSISTFNGYLPAGYATYYPNGNVTNVTQTWWEKLINKTGMVLCRNASWSGSRLGWDISSDTTAYSGASDARIADLVNPDTQKTPDIIICYICTNDWGHSTPIGEYSSKMTIPFDGHVTTISEGYALMLYKIRTTYPKAIVYCFTHLDGRHHPINEDDTFPIQDNLGQTLHEVNHMIIELAHIFGARVIDLETNGCHPWNIQNYTVDGHLHPNDAGMTLIANTAYRQMITDFS